MTSESPPEINGTAGQNAEGGGESGKQSTVKTRKRTKTGCLTCRKRRIKCDEGRPTCHNCYKSKRQCEGYQPSRLQFRQNTNDFTASEVTYSFASPVNDYHQAYASSAGQFTSIRPRPLHAHGFSPAEQAQWAQSPSALQGEMFDPAQMSELMAAQMDMTPSVADYMNTYPDALFAGGYNQAGRQDSQGEVQGMQSHPPQHMNALFSSQSFSQSGMPQFGLQQQFPVPNPVSSEGNVWNPNIQTYDASLYTTVPQQHFDFTETVYEEELYDVDSDEERSMALERNQQTGLPLMMSVHGQFDVRALRSIDTFLHTPNILVNYEPQWHASPLVDPTTARIFSHFIAVTACHLSLGQRRASNPSLLFQPRAVPKSQQGLWTYILPQKALSNQGLMHAMLALASLQIAMLQGTDRHTARKHYHFAIRRNGKAVGSAKKRTTIATIATTLLLACFEVWAADHSNWNSHLIGARQLLIESGFIRMTRRIKEHKLTASPTADPEDSYIMYLQQKAGPVLQAEMPDEALLEKMMGYKVPYGDHGVEVSVDPQGSPTQADIDTYDSYADLFWFFAKQDIYYSTISSRPLMFPFERWGECPPRAPMGKLDAIYGTSDHLMMIYGRIARFIADDLARKKKALEANGGVWRPPPGLFEGPMPGGPSRGANGSSARSKGMPSQGARQAGAAPGRVSPPSPPQGPAFMGMIPDPPLPRMPSAFKDRVADQAYAPAQKEQDEVGNLEQATQDAVAEWNDMQSALSAFEAQLQSPEWQPLPLQAAMPLATHFGSALQYGDYRISDIWGMFYTAKIILARVHPSMPPAALMAAGVCAKQTASWANTVGKIVFGMQTPGESEPLNPTFASVLTQNMYTLFFAGVQFREPAQRLICVQRLQYIAEKVGHESSALIAAALETCWINAHKMGRGPEWQRRLDLEIDAGDENRRTEFRTMERKRDGATVYVRSNDVRTEFGMGVMGMESDFNRMNLV